MAFATIQNKRKWIIHSKHEFEIGIERSLWNFNVW